VRLPVLLNKPLPEPEAVFVGVGADEEALGGLLEGKVAMEREGGRVGHIYGV